MHGSCHCARVCYDSLVLPSRHGQPNTSETSIHSDYEASTWTGVLLLTVAAFCCTQKVTLAAAYCTSLEASFTSMGWRDVDKTRRHNEQRAHEE